MFELHNDVAHKNILTYNLPLTNNGQQPANAAMHGPHSLVRVGPGCADRAQLQ